MSAGQPAKVKPIITIGKFQNIDIRVARVVSAPLAAETRNPARVLTLDLGPLGERVSVGQYALIPEEELIGRNVAVVVNFAPRNMGSYISEVLVLGAPHPNSPADQAQATPLYIADNARPGDSIY